MTRVSPGFASIEFLPWFKSFKNGASEVFRIVVTNFNPNVTIPVVGSAGSAPDETFNFPLSEITCPVGPTAMATATQPATLVVTHTESNFDTQADQDAQKVKW
jgi:hypothetical protein